MPPKRSAVSVMKREGRSDQIVEALDRGTISEGNHLRQHLISVGQPEMLLTHGTHQDADGASEADTSPARLPPSRQIVARQDESLRDGEGKTRRFTSDLSHSGKVGKDGCIEDEA